MRTLSGTRRWTKAARGPSAGSPSSSAPTTTTWPSSGETSLYVGSPPKQTQTQTHRYTQTYRGGCVLLPRTQGCAVWKQNTPQIQTTHACIRECNLWAFIHMLLLLTNARCTKITGRPAKGLIWFVMTVIQWASELCLTPGRAQWKHHSRTVSSPYLARLSAHPNTFTSFIFFHPSLFGWLFYLLFLIRSLFFFF